MGKVTPIREQVLYLYVEDKFIRAFEDSKELEMVMGCINVGNHWALYDKDMNIVEEGVK